MKITTKQLAQTALLLTLCLISQYFKNISVYITGPFINTCLIIATLYIGLPSGIFLSIITPITAFFFTGSPIMAAIPLMFPAVMLGNCVLCVILWFFYQRKQTSTHLAVSLLCASICKALFMTITIAAIIIPTFGHLVADKIPKPEALPVILQGAKITFSITQLITALLGSFLAYFIWIAIKNTKHTF